MRQTIAERREQERREQMAAEQRAALPDDIQSNLRENNDFISSDAILSADDVHRMYELYFDRPADAGALAAYTGKRANNISSILEDSFEFQMRTNGSVRPIERDPELERRGNYTYENFIGEWNQVNARPPTQLEYENWMKYGEPNQLFIEGSGLVRDLQDPSGAVVRVYMDLSALGDQPFDFGGEGSVVAVPHGTTMGGGGRWEKLSESEEFDVYVKKSKDQSALGRLARITGINEFEDLRDKWIPKEHWAFMGPAGQAIAGRRAFDGQAAVAEPLGLKGEEVAMAGNIATYVAGAVLSPFTFGLSNVAATAIVSRSQQAVSSKSNTDLLTDVGISALGTYGAAFGSAVGAGINSSRQGGDIGDIALSAAISGGTSYISSGINTDNAYYDAIARAGLAAGATYANGGDTQQALMNASISSLTSAGSAATGRSGNGQVSPTTQRLFGHFARLGQNRQVSGGSRPGNSSRNIFGIFKKSPREGDRQTGQIVRQTGIGETVTTTGIGEEVNRNRRR